MHDTVFTQFTEINCKEFVKQGGVQSVINMIKSFPEVYEAVYRGLCALITLALVQDTKLALQKEHILPHIKVIQKNFSDNQEIQGLIEELQANL